MLVVGNDPGNDLAATLYQAGLVTAGLAATVESRGLGMGELDGLVSSIREDQGIVGLAVTMPYTVPVTDLLDGLGPEAQRIKAVNTISHRAGALIGWNTNRVGFAAALEEADFALKGRSVLVLGAGGAARSCVDVLRDSASRIWVTSPDLEEARRVCRDLEVAAGGPTPMGSLSLVVRKVDLIVNATPVGNDGGGVLFPIEWITPAQFVFDLVYQPPLTPLLRGARERGARAINGLSMLLFQALAAFEIWTGQPAPEAAMRTALERAVLEQLRAS